MRPPVWIRKLLRPLIPDRIMARFRLHQHSRQARTNVDVVIDAAVRQRRWLATTPDTYRVRGTVTFPTPAEGAAGPASASEEVKVVGREELAPAELEDLLRPLGDPEVDAAVLGEVGRPTLVARRRTEPIVGPIAIAMRPAVWGEVGTAPPNEDLPAALDRLRATGRRLALIPRDRGNVPIERADPIDEPSVVILCAVPMHDVGGGSRGAQLALELLRRGYYVAHVALYGTAESVDLGLRFIHPRLEQYRGDAFDPVRFAARTARSDSIVLVELPAPPFMTTAEALQRSGFLVVYDLIDDWSAPSLGGEWYRKGIENRFIAMADGLVASAPDLCDRLRRAGGEPRLVPNAVNEQVFGGEAGPRPVDLPQSDGPLLGYHGSLYGDWLDWEGLAAVARRHPSGRVIVIGDEGKGHPPVPQNVRFLGLKPQGELPSYAARFDVGLVPFRASGVTHAVSPLKAYEYLACGVPVAAPPLRSLRGLEGVYVADELVDAVELALSAPRPDRSEALARHSWGARLTEIFDGLGFPPAPVSDPGALIVLRPAVHFTRGQRLL